MQSRRRLKSSPLCAYRKGSLCRSYRSLLLLLFFCPLFISFWRRLLVTCQLFTLLPSQRFHLCVPPPSLSPVTHWLLRSSFFLPFFLPSRFPPPLLAPPVTAIAARLRIIYRNWSERAASPLKPVEIASEGKPGGKVEGDLVCFSALLLPCFACRRIFSYAFSFFSFFFLVFLFFFFLMSWSSFREEAGLLVSLEGGEGGELVPYSSLQECEIWFENGEPSHTLFCSFHSSICARKLCFTPSPSLQPSPLVTCCSTFPCTELVCCVARPLVRMTFVKTRG